MYRPRFQVLVITACQWMLHGAACSNLGVVTGARLFVNGQEFCVLFQVVIFLVYCCIDMPLEISKSDRFDTIFFGGPVASVKQLLSAVGSLNNYLFSGGMSTVTI